MKIGDIVNKKQPEVIEKLHKKSSKRKRGKSNSHLSFSYLDKLMKERSDVDESKCRGR